MARGALHGNKWMKAIACCQIEFDIAGLIDDSIPSLNKSVNMIGSELVCPGLPWPELYMYPRDAPHALTTVLTVLTVLYFHWKKDRDCHFPSLL